MTYINPISGTAMAGAVQQNQLAADKTRQIRHQQKLQRNAAAATDQFEHAVENTEEVAAIHDEQRRERPQPDPKERHKHEPDEDPEAEDHPHIDVTG